MVTVIAGGGIAGFETALRLERKGEEVIIVDPGEEMVFYPSIHKILEKNGEACSINYREKFHGRDIEHIQDRLTGINRDGDNVKLEESGKIGYDRLVLSPGSVSDFGSVDVESKTHSLRFREETREINDRLGKDKVDDIVVVGGGATGVEAAASLVSGRGSEDFNVTVVHTEEELLPGNGEKLGLKARKRLESKEVEVLLDEKVEVIEEDQVKTSSGREIDSDVTVWAGGVKPNPVIDNLDLPKNGKGVKVGKEMKVEGTENIFGAGDFVNYPGKENRAYHAIKEAKTVAKNILKEQKWKEERGLEELEEVKIRWEPHLVHLGYRDAGFEAFSFCLTGIIPHLMREYFVEKRYMLLRKHFL